MFWSEHSYIEYSTTYVGCLTLRRNSAFLRRIKISCLDAVAACIGMEASWGLRGDGVEAVWRQRT